MAQNSLGRPPAASQDTVANYRQLSGLGGSELSCRTLSSLMTVTEVGQIARTTFRNTERSLAVGEVPTSGFAVPQAASQDAVGTYLTCG